MYDLASTWGKCDKIWNIRSRKEVGGGGDGKNRITLMESLPGRKKKKMNRIWNIRNIKGFVYHMIF